MTPNPEGTPPEPLAVRRRRPSLWRSAFYAASLAVLLWAGFAVPLPFVENVPGPPSEIAPLVEIEGAEVTELDGSTSLLTVFLRQQPTIRVLAAWLDDDRRLLPAGRVFPADVDREEYLRQERERFGRQFEVAAAVGAREAGYDTELITEAVIVQTLPGTAAEGLLEQGDAVLAVDGDPIATAEELQARVRERAVGDELTLTIRRNDDELRVTVTLGEAPDVDWPVVGVLIETAVDELRLPFEVRLTEGTRIGGPSAGMMVAVTVYDLLSEENLLRGRTVMGTGTIDADGRVGTVGGVPEKMIAASEHGADVVLVPRPQLDLALARAPAGLEVIGVETLEDALEALRAS